MTGGRRTFASLFSIGAAKFGGHLRTPTLPAVLDARPGKCLKITMAEKQELPRTLRWGSAICVVIAVAAVIRRVIALAHPAHSGPPQLLALDAVFASHATLTLAHILPALFFVLLCPLAIFREPRTKPWLEKLFFPIGAVVGITAYAMNAHAIGGWTERTAVLFFNSLFLFSMGRAFLAWKHGDALMEQRWMLRAMAILLGIATTRPVMGIFFATSRFTHLEPNQFFGIAFWIGFSINTLVVELWLRRASPLSNHDSGDQSRSWSPS